MKQKEMYRNGNYFANLFTHKTMEVSFGEEWFAEPKALRDLIKAQGHLRTFVCAM